MKNVNRYTRASKRGTPIFCPHCNGANIVLRFNWKDYQCTYCKVISEKNHYFIDEEIPQYASYIRYWFFDYICPKKKEELDGIPAYYIKEYLKQKPDYFITNLFEHFRIEVNVKKNIDSLSDIYKIFRKMLPNICQIISTEHLKKERKMKLMEIFG